jgi:LysM repeat protein
MNRRQIAFVVVLNALISLVVALAVVWAVEARRPDSEALAIPISGAAPITQLPAVDTANNLSTTAPLPDATQTTPTEPGNAEPVATLDPATQQIYVIQAGDSLSAVASRFGTTLDAIIQANGLTDPNVVYVGQRLIIGGQASNNDNNTGNDSSAITPTQTVSESTPAPEVIGQGMLIRAIDTPGTLLTEAVQIVNESNTVVSLIGWRLERENGPAYTFGERSVFPGAPIWLHTVSGDDTTVALYWNQTEPIWQSGNIARLINAQGTLIHSYTVP